MNTDLENLILMLKNRNIPYEKTIDGAFTDIWFEKEDAICYFEFSNLSGELIDVVVRSKVYSE